MHKGEVAKGNPPRITTEPLLVKEVFKLYISAWASALLVRTGWAMRRPQSAG